MASPAVTLPALTGLQGLLAKRVAPDGGIAPAGSRAASTINAGSQAVPAAGGTFQTLAGGQVVTPATPQMNVTAQIQPVAPQSANPLPTPPTTTPIAAPRFNPQIDQGLAQIQQQALSSATGALPTYDPNIDLSLDPALAGLRTGVLGGIGGMVAGEGAPGAAILGQFDALVDPLRERYGVDTQNLLKNTAIAGRGGLGHVGTQFGDLELALRRSEQNVASQLSAEAAKADAAYRTQGLQLGGQFLSDEQRAALERQGLLASAEQASVGLGLQGLGVQQQGLATAANAAAQRASAEAARQGLSLDQQRAAADEAYRRTALQQEGALTREGFQNQQQVAGIHAAASERASQAAAQASMYGADKAAQTAAANLAYEQEANRQRMLLSTQQLEHEMGMDQAQLGLQNQAFQYQMSRDPVEDTFRTLGLLGQYGFMGEPDLNAAFGGLQNAYGQGVANYGADAAQSGAAAGQAFGGLAQLPFIYAGMNQPRVNPQIPFVPGLI